MLGLPHIALLPSAGSSAAPTSSWQDFLDALQKLGNDPTALSIRIGLSFAVLLVALIGGRWLASLAGRAPLRFESSLTRASRLRRRKQVQQTSIGPWLSRLTALSIWLAALLALAAVWFSAFGGQPTLRPRDLGQFFIALAAQVGGSLLVFAAMLGIARVFERSLEKSLQHRVNPNLALLAARVLYVVVILIGFVIILGIWNTGIVLPVTIIGALTVALSLSLQDVLKNLVSGVYLLLERPFTIGDRITLAAYTGIIEDIQIRYTALRTADGERVIIPNSMLFSTAVVNLSAYQNRRASFTVTVPDHGANSIDAAVLVIRGALDSAPDVLKAPAPEVALTRTGNGTADLRAVYWMPSESADSRAAVISHLVEQVRSQVDGAEINVLDAATT